MSAGDKDFEYGFALGVVLTSALIAATAAYHGVHPDSEAVLHGCAEWITQDDGGVAFRWKDDEAAR